MWNFSPKHFSLKLHFYFWRNLNSSVLELVVSTHLQYDLDFFLLENNYKIKGNCDRLTEMRLGKYSNIFVLPTAKYILYNFILTLSTFHQMNNLDVVLMDWKIVIFHKIKKVIVNICFMKISNASYWCDILLSKHIHIIDIIFNAFSSIL